MQSNEITKQEKIANILAFLFILFGDDKEVLHAIMKKDPDYIIEKYERYVESYRVEFPWGMHPMLRNGIFQRYVDKWKLGIRDIDEYGL